MGTLHFTTRINAPKEKVWKTLWDDETYRQWTSVFSPTSYMKTEGWNEGDKVLFLDGTGSGMVSRIEKIVPNEYLSFKHLGEVKDGVEDTESERVKTWAGAKENYTLKETGGATELAVDVDIDESHKNMFEGLFPKSLELVKTLAERN